MWRPALRGLLLGFHLLHGLRRHGAVRTGQASWGTPGCEWVLVVDCCQLAPAYPDITGAQ